MVSSKVKASTIMTKEGLFMMENGFMIKSLAMVFSITKINTMKDNGKQDTNMEMDTFLIK